MQEQSGKSRKMFTKNVLLFTMVVVKNRFSFNTNRKTMRWKCFKNS